MNIYTGWTTKGWLKKYLIFTLTASKNSWIKEIKRDLTTLNFSKDLAKDEDKFRKVIQESNFSEKNRKVHTWTDRWKKGDNDRENEWNPFEEKSQNYVNVILSGQNK